jgi:hypothetical protein
MAKNGKSIISEEAFDKLKSEHGDGRVCIVETEAGDLAFRAPTRHEMKRFNQSVTENKSRPDAIDTLVRQTIVQPPLPELDALLDIYPGIAATVINPILELSGVTEQPRVRK